VGRTFRQVDYDRASWEQRIERGFTNVIRVYERFLAGRAPLPAREEARIQSLRALARVAGMAALGAKHAEWSEEEEWRVLALWWRGKETKAPTYTRQDGTVAEYMPLPMRARGRLLVLDEIIVGPREDFDSASTRATEILQAAGYPSDDAPLPPIVRSRFSRG